MISRASPNVTVMAHLVGTVIVLRVVLKDLLLLRILKIGHEIIEIHFLSPFFAVEEPCLYFSTNP